MHVYNSLCCLCPSFSYKQCTSSLPLFQRNKQTHEVDGMWNSFWQQCPSSVQWYHLTEEGHCCQKLFHIPSTSCVCLLRWKRGRELVHCLWCAPGFFQMKIFGCGWSRQCIHMACWQKNWWDREQWQNLFSRKSENLYKEKFHTPSKNLAEQLIEVHSFVFCWCHQNRMTTRAQWTQKSKGSLFVTCHYSQTKFVSIFMQHTVVRKLNGRSAVKRLKVENSLPSGVFYNQVRNDTTDLLRSHLPPAMA